MLLKLHVSDLKIDKSNTLGCIFEMNWWFNYSMSLCPPSPPPVCTFQFPHVYYAMRITLFFLSNSLAGPLIDAGSSAVSLPHLPLIGLYKTQSQSALNWVPLLFHPVNWNLILWYHSTLKSANFNAKHTALCCHFTIYWKSLIYFHLIKVCYTALSKHTEVCQYALISL